MASKPRSYRDARIAFVHGRPGPHPTHTALANAINAEFVFVDRILRYHDLEDTGKVRRYASWLLNSLFFRHVRKYDLILSEGMHVPPTIMKKLRILRSDQKIAAVLGDECLFFMRSGLYPPKTMKLLSYTLRQYDALLCMSDFQTELANDVLERYDAKPKVITAHEIISGDRPMPTGNENGNRDGHKLIFVAHGPSGWRGFYKGIETLLASFKLVSLKYPDANLTVIGDWDEDYVNDLLVKTDNLESKIEFVGRQKDLPAFFASSDLCVHVTNGDAFPIATLEAIRAGLPTIVSNLTGTKEVVQKVDENLVVPMDPEVVSSRIDWYFSLSSDERKRLSDRGRSVMLDYSEEKGIQEFREAIDTVLNG